MSKKFILLLLLIPFILGSCKKNEACEADQLQFTHLKDEYGFKISPGNFLNKLPGYAVIHSREELEKIIEPTNNLNIDFGEFDLIVGLYETQTSWGNENTYSFSCIKDQPVVEVNLLTSQVNQKDTAVWEILVPKINTDTEIEVLVYE